MALWDRIAGSGNIEDRRDQLIGVGGLGAIGSVLVIASIIYSVLSGGSIDTSTVTRVLDELSKLQGTAQQVDTSQFSGEDDYETFASKVLASSNELWGGIFRDNNRRYEEPRLVLFRGATESGCGVARSEIGPHYCPADATIYLDETFFADLTSRLGARGGDVAEAYVIAHEIGHHVQNQLGVLDAAQESNEASVAIELQADCYAGIWAQSVARAGVIGPGEINEAVDAAAAVGDDRIQRQSGEAVHPETWTHGSSAERVAAFERGYQSGSPAVCSQ